MTEVSRAEREQQRYRYAYDAAPYDTPDGWADVPRWRDYEDATRSIPPQADNTPRFSAPKPASLADPPKRRTFAEWAFGPPKQPLPKMTVYRVICGICWAIWTFVSLLYAVSAPGGVVGGLILAVLFGFYDWRIWTRRTRFLTILLIF
jgi:hypothetical protein